MISNKNLKILLVEDEEEILNQLKYIIKSKFNNVFTANNGEKGLEEFIRIKPDIVITDIMMPKLTGLEMAQEIKKINANPNIIVLSAFSDKEQLLNAIDIGIKKYFIKPFDPDELLDYIVDLAKELRVSIIYLMDNYKFCLDSNILYNNDKIIRLTNIELKFLKLLVNSKNELINIDEIKISIYPEEDCSDERIRTFIKRLRIKTSKNLIENIKGKGYKIVTK